MKTKHTIYLIEWINKNRDSCGFLRILWKIILRVLNYECEKKNAFIPWTAVIGSNLCLPHGISGIYISGGAVIGDNCTIFHQVTIGSNTLADSLCAGSPHIGNNVYIGAGAKIIGNVNIGDNVRIGANCVVAEDVPNNSTVVMPKARIIIHQKERENTFIEYNHLYN